MSQLVDSQALQTVSKTLQLSTPGAEETLFIDERLEQVLDVGPLIRRGLTLAGTEGLYTANIRNTHSGAEGNVANVVDPWNLGGSARPPFPGRIPLNQDLWITGFSAEVVSGGSGEFDEAFFDLFIPTTHQAFGTVTTNIVLAGWISSSSLAGTVHLTKRGSQTIAIYSEIKLRVPRDATFRFHTRNVGATAPVFQLNLLLGLFPSSLGQDGFG